MGGGGWILDRWYWYTGRSSWYFLLFQKYQITIQKFEIIRTSQVLNMDKNFKYFKRIFKHFILCINSEALNF